MRLVARIPEMRSNGSCGREGGGFQQYGWRIRIGEATPGTEKTTSKKEAEGVAVPVRGGSACVEHWNWTPSTPRLSRFCSTWPRRICSSLDSEVAHYKGSKKSVLRSVTARRGAGEAMVW